jgi:DNA-binding response OmpR family regulator
VLNTGPDLVVLDVILVSDLEGFEVARTLREEHNLKELPILMLTAVHGVKKVPYRFAPDEKYLPVDVFIDKPIEPETLVETIEEMLGKRREEPKYPL